MEKIVDQYITIDGLVESPIHKYLHICVVSTYTCRFLLTGLHQKVRTKQSGILVSSKWRADGLIREHEGVHMDI